MCGFPGSAYDSCPNSSQSNWISRYSDSDKIEMAMLVNHSKYPAAPTVTSSLEQAGKEAACPGETVTFTCTVYESISLQWNFHGQTAKFAFVDDVGKILTREGFTATLLDIVNNNELLISSLTTVLQLNYNGSHVNCTDGQQSTSTKLLTAGL